MPDPFERARRIRAGELDGEMPSFEELTGWLGRVPITWLPGLLAKTVEMCVLCEAFRPDKLLPFVQRAFDSAGDYFRLYGKFATTKKETDEGVEETTAGLLPSNSELTENGQV